MHQSGAILVCRKIEQSPVIPSIHESCESNSMGAALAALIFATGNVAAVAIPIILPRNTLLDLFFVEVTCFPLRLFFWFFWWRRQVTLSTPWTNYS